MKAIYLLLLLTIIDLGQVKGQSIPSTEEDFKKYILANKKDYDPIIGIYRVDSYEERYIKGELVKRIRIPGRDTKYAIIRKESCFAILALPSNDFKNTSCYFIPTSTPGIYLKDSDKWYINNEGTLMYTYEESVENVAKIFKTNTISIVKAGLTIKLSYEYTKLFPTQGDLVNHNEIKENKLTGTGFALSSDGYLVTNYHVIKEAKSIKVRGINGNFTINYRATIAIADKNNDLAILKVDDPGFKTLGNIPYIINNESSDVGESVFVLGYPLTATMGEEIKLTNGIISSKSGFQGDVTAYQISAPVQSGNSGGPLFDSRGTLVGIINAKHAEAENASYAVKSSYLINLFNALPSKPKTQNLNSMLGKSLSEQVKRAKAYVYIIEVDNMMP